MRKIYLDKFPDKPTTLKTTLMFIQDGKICDGCDTKSTCASIHLLCGDVSILCQDCIEGILESFPSYIRDKQIDEILS